MATILYHGEPNGPSLAVLAALGESGLDIACQPIDLLKGERHTLPQVTEPVARDMGVEGEGPVLVIDGEAMTESVFIAQYLDEAGANTLQPKDAHAHWQMLMWCRRITERAAPAAAFLGCQASAHDALAAMDEADFAALTDAIASEDLRHRWVAVRAGDFPEGPCADSVTKVSDAVKMVDDQLADGREWLMGPLTIADFETYGWLAGMTAVVPDAFAGKDRAAAWMERVRARPSVQAALARATMSNPEASWAPGPEINRWG
ncbi:MAG: glutathione S-transferase N-terminal domain-containing protein [Sphingomonadales bacterium]|nr:glutathione S-transferase N-terminal domain-containing protein [Sphingomonadales bacterium]MDE2567435.1 glutathione S-transferase N-terminal domain-containing protein [Sphingomonadales bacterium]